MEEFKKIICDLLDSVSEQHRNSEAKYSQLEASLTKRISEVEENYDVLKKQFEMIVEENKVLKGLNEDLTQRINDLYDVYADKTLDDGLNEEEKWGEETENSFAELEGQQEEGAEVYRLVQEMDKDDSSEEKEVEEEIGKMDQRLFIEDENPENYAYSLFDAKFKQPEEVEEVEPVEEVESMEAEESEEPEAEPQVGREEEDGEIELSLFDTLIKDVDGQRPQWITDNPGPAVSKITHGITINDKIMYINSLFNGDSVLYKRTMSLLEDFPTFGEAYTFLREQFPEWDESSHEVYSFYMTVRRKLRS